MKYSDYYEGFRKRLLAIGQDENEARAEIELLKEYISGIGPAEWFLRREKDIPEEEISKLEEISHRLETSEPIDYIIGRRWFCGLEFLVDKSTLIPRQETEILVEECVKTLSKMASDREKLNVFDLCTGSGCIIISIALLLKQSDPAAYKKTVFMASDISASALNIARQNAEKLGADVNFFESDMFEAVQKPENGFDLIVSNPPYIPDSELGKLDTRVTGFEPHAALFGGEDGLEFYRIIAKDAQKYLNKGGRLLLEIGFDQGNSVPLLLGDEDYENIIVKKDYAGQDRIVAAFRK